MYLNEECKAHTCSQLFHKMLKGDIIWSYYVFISPITKCSNGQINIVIGIQRQTKKTRKPAYFGVLLNFTE
jgi:hypothetical protein